MAVKKAEPKAPGCPCCDGNCDMPINKKMCSCCEDHEKWDDPYEDQQSKNVPGYKRRPHICHSPCIPHDPNYIAVEEGEEMLNDSQRNS